MRQFLSFYRDAQYEDYIDALEQLLNCEVIRPHLKVVCVQCCFEVAEPTKEEWDIFEPYLLSKYGLKSIIPESNIWLVEIIWRNFNSSSSFLKYGFSVNKRLQKWLHEIAESHFKHILVAYWNGSSENEEEIRDAFSPFLEKGEEQVAKVKMLCERVKLEDLGLLFDLFLAAFDKGAYDHFDNGVWNTGRFWTIVQSDYEKSSKNILYAIKAWLRKAALFSEGISKENLHSLYEIRGDEPSHYLMNAAKSFPYETLGILLPELITLMSSCIIEHEKGELKFDYAVRFNPCFARSSEFPESLVFAISESLKIQAKLDPDKASKYVKQLVASQFSTSNFIACHAYLGNPEYFSDYAITLLLKEPLRFDDGYFWHEESVFFMTRQVLKACSKYCSNKLFDKLEKFILLYSQKTRSSYSTNSRLRLLNRDRYYLLEALDLNRLSAKAVAQLQVYERRFSKPVDKRGQIHGGLITSPIAAEKTEKMTNANWLKAFTKYDSEDRSLISSYDSLKGGAWELARQFGAEVQKSPLDHIELMLTCPLETHPAYIAEGIEKLSISEVSDENKIKLFDRYRGLIDRQVIKCLVSMIGSISSGDLSVDMLNYLHRLASYYPCPTSKQLRGSDDLLNDGFNTVRGGIALACRSLIVSNSLAHIQLADVTTVLANDPSNSVRASALMMLSGIVCRDKDQGFKFFRTAIDTDDSILTSRSLWAGLSRICPNYFHEVETTLKRALNSKIPEAVQEATKIVCYYNAITMEGEELLELAKLDSDNGMLIIIEVATRHFHHEAFRGWSKRILITQLESENKKFADSAGNFIWTLRREGIRGDDYSEILDAYCKSKGSSKNVDYGIDYFTNDYEGNLPESIVDLCENAMNYGLAKGLDTFEYNQTLYRLPELVFRYYKENKNRASKRKGALDLIDQMCENSIGVYHRDFSEIER